MDLRAKYPDETGTMRSLRHELVSATDSALETVQSVFAQFDKIYDEQRETIRQLEDEVRSLSAYVEELEAHINAEKGND
jgi:phosphoserine phosphatase